MDRNQPKLVAGLALAISLVALAPAAAQDPVNGLQDLVGELGRNAEPEIERRGYVHDHTQKSDTDSYVYFRHGRRNECIVAHVTDGRYASIVHSQGDCNGGAPAAAAARDEAGGGFATVCGVITGGQTYRYVCHVHERDHDGSRVATIKFPDVTLKAYYGEHHEVRVETEGIADREGTYSTHEGETDIVLGEQTYFYVSDEGMAAMEVEHFHD